MARTSGRRRRRTRLSESERYRLAAETALDQLDWAINYLHEQRETRVARALAANRARIRQRMR